LDLHRHDIHGDGAVPARSDVAYAWATGVMPMPTRDNLRQIVYEVLDAFGSLMYWSIMALVAIGFAIMTIMVIGRLIGVI